MTRGRPSGYKTEYCGIACRLMEKGFSKLAVAGKLGISRDTLYEWCKSHSEFSDTIKKGEMKSALFWEQIGIDGAQGKIKGFNGGGWIFTMKSRFKWRDNPEYKEDPLDTLLSESPEEPKNFEPLEKKLARVLNRRYFLTTDRTKNNMLKEVQEVKQEINSEN